MHIFFYRAYFYTYRPWHAIMSVVGISHCEKFRFTNLSDKQYKVMLAEYLLFFALPCKSRKILPAVRSFIVEQGAKSCVRVII